MTKVTFISLVAVSIFCGFMIAVVGGAISPPLVMTVAEPMVCDGTLELASENFSYKPGQSGVAHEISCVRDGESTPETMTVLVVAVASAVYSFISFLILLPLFYLFKGSVEIERIPSVAKDFPGLGDSAEKLSSKASSSRSASDRIKELQALLDAQLITKEEFEKKKKEIISGI